VLDYSAGSKLPYLFVDGTEVTYSAQNDGGAGAPVTDVGNDLYIGNRSDNNRTWDGGIGWCRLSSGRLYTANFTPPPRCELPEIRASTIAQWIGPENTGTTIDNQEGTAALDGTADDHNFGECPADDCACVEVGATGPGPPWHLEFNATTSDVQVPDNAVIQDLHDDAMTVEAWVRADGWGENNAGRIVAKSTSGTVGWEFYITSSGGALGANIHCAVLDGNIEDSLFDADGEWHHVAFTWNDATMNYPRLWFDGMELVGTTTQNRNGAIVSDVGADLFIGNYSNATRTWDGGIGWCRVSDALRYTASFTPPPRCELPLIDGNTIGQWIGAEAGGTTIDNQEGTAAIDGTASNCTFDTDCELTGREATCSNEVYIANKHNRSQLTNVHIDDGGALGRNIMGRGVPFDLLPAVPAATDAVYFGVDTTFPDTGPFCSLVFDIQTAITGVTGTIWEYWSGAAWSTLTVQDNTNADGAGTGVAFDTVGVNSVHWVQPSNWATNNPGMGVTGYWVRMRVTAAAGATAPVQQNRDVYTILWPYVEVDGDEVRGDIEALLRAMLYNQSKGRVSPNPDLPSSRVVAGLRSTNRGTDFTPYLNMADEQNPGGVFLQLGVGASYANDVTTATGRRVDVTRGAGTSTNVIVSIFPATLVNEYRGKHHAFLRAYQTNGSSGDVEVWLRVQWYNQDLHVGERSIFQNTNDWQLIDFGRVDLLSGFRGDETTGQIDLIVEIENVSGGSVTLRLYELVLMPVDEWSVDTHEVNATVGETLDSTVYLDVDSVLHPKRSLRALIRSAIAATLDNIWNIWSWISASPAKLQANATQRMWFLSTRENGTDDWRSEPYVAFSSQFYAVARYLSMRGDR
jgi:hypothetical protein